MKTIITLSLLLVLTLSASAQERFEYTYDDAGNRIKREYFAFRIAPEDNSPGTGDGADAVATKEAISPEQAETSEDEDPWVTEGGMHSFKLYPNPTQGIIQVEAEDGFMDRDNKHASVHDMNGKLLQAMDINSQTFRVDFSGYAAGSYVVRITANGYRKEFVIVKQ